VVQAEAAQADAAQADAALSETALMASSPYHCHNSAGMAVVSAVSDMSCTGKCACACSGRLQPIKPVAVRPGVPRRRFSPVLTSTVSCAASPNAALAEGTSDWQSRPQVLAAIGTLRPPAAGPAGTVARRRYDALQSCGPAGRRGDGVKLVFSVQVRAPDGTDWVMRHL